MTSALVVLLLGEGLLFRCRRRFRFELVILVSLLRP